MTNSDLFEIELTCRCSPGAALQGVGDPFVGTDNHRRALQGSCCHDGADPLDSGAICEACTPEFQDLREEHLDGDSIDAMRWTEREVRLHGTFCEEDPR